MQQQCTDHNILAITTMKLLSRTRGTSSTPQPSLSLTSASLKLAYATKTLHPSRRKPQHQQSLGSPFIPRPVRGSTPSTTSSGIAPVERPGYWLRSSGTSELEH